MTDIQKQLEPIVDSYYNELISQDTSVLDGYEFSEKYLKRREELIAKMYPIKKKHNHNIRRRIIFALIAAVILGTITVAAYEPARNFFLNLLSDHTEVIPADENSETDTHKSVIEKKFAITVSEGYVLDKESSSETETIITSTYYNSDKTKSIMFNQYVKETYSTTVDNKKSILVEKTDQNGQQIMVHNTENKSVSIIWNNGEYYFELSGEMSEQELMDIYYSVK